jgi:carboxymethylenebutenolidase
MAARERTRIGAADGQAEAWLCRPERTGKHPGILFYMDGLGVRPTLVDMAGRLADLGYVVLLPDLIYRSGPRAPFDPAVALTDPAERDRLFALFASIDARKVMRDTHAYMAALGGIEDVAVTPIGCLGYCMGGGFAVTAAGTYPERVAAAASIHGANVATEHPESPHHLVPRIRGRVYVGVAEIDPWLAPGETERLRSALETAGVDHRVEIYAGVQHGFAVEDLPVYDRAAAERHWRDLEGFFGAALRTSAAPGQRVRE